MSVENLQVEEHQDKIKNTVTKDKEDSVKKFLKDIKEARDTADKTTKNTFDTEMKTAKKEKYNDERKNTIRENYEKKQSTEIQKAAMKAFIDQSPIIINAITENIATNFDKVGKTKWYDLQPFIEAKKAFQEDIDTFNTKENIIPEQTNIIKAIEENIQALQNQIDLKQIENNPTYMNTAALDKWKLTNLSTLSKKSETQKIINDKITELDKNEKTNTNIELNKNRTHETAKTFFESNESSFNGLFDEVSNITKENLEKYTSTDKTQENKVKNFVDMIKLYWQGLDISNINLKVASPTDKYRTWTRIINFNSKIAWTPAIETKPAIPEKIVSKDAVFWTQDQMQANKAEKFDITKVDLSWENPLAQFDGNGNYKALEKYIKANPEQFDINFKNVANAILSYQNKTTKNDKWETIKEVKETSDSEEDLTSLKNGYANILTDHVINNPTSMKIYMTYLAKGNADILWWDEVTRIANLQKLKNSPTFMTEFNSLSNEQKTLMGEFMRDEVTKEKKISIMDALVKLMTMFGFWKWKLKKRFPGMGDKIDGIYNTQFEIKDANEKAAIKDLTEKSELDTKPLWRRVKKDDNTEEYTSPKWSEIKEKFKNTKMIDKITKDENMYKWLDPAVIQQWIKLYNNNKEKKINYNESDFIANKNIKKNIDANKLKDILTAITDDNWTFDIIAKANNNIQKISTDSEKKQYSEYFNNPEEKNSYSINTEEDIGKYLVSYLFAGSKDLAYTMTESWFKMNRTDTPVITTTPEPIKKAETLVFNTGYVDEKGIITKDVKKEKIHDIIDMKTAPENIKITGKRNWKEITTIGKLDKTYKEGGKTISTYVDNSWKRIPVFKWDKISLSETTPEITINQKRESIKANLNDTKKSVDKTSFEKTDYILNDKNTYEKEIDGLSWLFTTEKNYTSIIWEKDIKTMKDMTATTNISHLKNMFTYRWLKQTKDNKDKVYGTDKMTLDKNIMSKIDSTKQTYTIEATTEKGIIITVNEWSTKKWDISIKNTSGKLETKRTEKTTQA